MDKNEKPKGEQKFAAAATILEAMTDGIIVLDMNGNIIQCNAALAKMHGFKTPEEMKGINISGLVVERDLQRAMNEVKNTFECGISANFGCTGKDKTGKEFPVLVNASVLKDEKGNVVGAIGVVGAQCVALRKTCTPTCLCIIDGIPGNTVSNNQFTLTFSRFQNINGPSKRILDHFFRIFTGLYFYNAWHCTFNDWHDFVQQH